MHQFTSFRLFAVAAVFTGTLIPASQNDGLAQARAGGGGGGGGARAGAVGASGGQAAAARAQTGQQATRTNVNRSAQVNSNVNASRNVNVNVDNNNGVYHPLAAAATVTAGVALTSAAIGSMVNTLPPSCAPVAVNGMTYQQCGSTWYQPQYAGTQVSYAVVSPPQ